MKHTILTLKKFMPLITIDKTTQCNKTFNKVNNKIHFFSGFFVFKIFIVKSVSISDDN